MHRGMAGWYLVWFSGLQEGVRCVGATHVRIETGNSIRATHDPCEVTCGARRILDGRIRSRRI